MKNCRSLKCLSREERRDASKLYNPMKVSELTTLDPTTPWLEYINTILTTDIVQVLSINLFILYYMLYRSLATK